MNPGAMLARILAATFLAPVIASLSIGVVAAAWWTVVGLASHQPIQQTASQVWTAFASFLVFGTLLFGVFSIIFTVLTQIPRLFAYRAWGLPPLIAHSTLTGIVGAAAFLLFAQRDGSNLWLDGLTDRENARNLILLGGMGLLGGIAVGFVWYKLVLRALTSSQVENV